LSDTVKSTESGEAARKAAQAAARERVWAALRKVARPDSRFHWDFSMFIADFEGSERCVSSIRRLTAYREAGLLFITPDNCLERFREAVVADGKSYVMTTYGIARGFLFVDPALIPTTERRYAATLDGVEVYSRPISLSELRAGEPIQLMVTGSSVISTNGVRFGKGHGYFDLEWAILSELGVVDGESKMIAVAHDCQVVEQELPAFEHDTILDLIVTPTRTLHVSHRPRPPGRIDWARVSPAMLTAIPSLGELRELPRAAGR
jgi:5-formyltetrahydrofolate cyclo-ligase